MKNIFAFIKKFWFLLPVLGLTLALVNTREKLAEKTTAFDTQKTAWDAERKAAAKQSEADEKRWNQSHELAVKIFDQQKAEREPVIVRALDTVREYEKTDASRVQCLDADWVRRLQDNRAALFPKDTGTPEGSAGSVRSQ